MLSAAVVLAGALAGGFVSGLAGFGTGLVGLGFWLYVVRPSDAASLVMLCSVAAQIQTIPTIWHALDAGRLLPFIAAGLAGVPVGMMLLGRLDPNTFRLLIGLLLLAYASFMYFARIRTRIVWGGRAADSAVGFAGGILGGFAGLSGPLPTVWATLRGWGKDERRGVFQAFNLVVLAAALLAQAAAGRLTGPFFRLALVALPGTFVGAWLGSRVYRRLSDRRFSDIVLLLLGLSGLALVWSSV